MQRFIAFFTNAYSTLGLLFKGLFLALHLNIAVLPIVAVFIKRIAVLAIVAVFIKRIAVLALCNCAACGA